MTELGHGGYSLKWRKEVLQDAIKGYTRIWQLEVDQKVHVNGPEWASANKRRAQKLVGKATWFIKPKSDMKVTQIRTSMSRSSKKDRIPNKVESVLFIPCTPNSELKNQLTEVERTINGHRKTGMVRIIEGSGPTLAQILHNRQPWSEKLCSRDIFLPCLTKPGSCRRSGVT